MGFLSFFTRKASADKSPAVLVKGQAYDSTVASLPPILGTYPVAGNGPNVLDQLQRAARKRSQAQLSVRSPDVDTDAAAAPAPLVPRFRGTTAERPSSAPGNSAGLNARPKSVARSVRNSSAAWPLVPEKSRTALSKGAYVLEKPPPVPSIAAHHRHNSSTDSFRGTGFVDILDAQGEIKPSNFRSRVKAAGARDYGEDVADRNLGENGVNLKSPAVQAFYALTGSDSATFRPDERVVDDYGNVYYAHDAIEEQESLDESAPPPVVAKGELAKDEWAKRVRRRQSREAPIARPQTSTASPWGSLSRTADMLDREWDQDQNTERRPKTHHSNRKAGQKDSALANRRKSFNAFASTPSSTRSKPRPLSLHPSLSNYSTGSASPPPVPMLPRSRRSARTDLPMDEALEFVLSVQKQRGDDRPHTRHSQMVKEAPSFHSDAVSDKRSRRSMRMDSLRSMPRRNSSPEAVPYGFGRVEMDPVADEAFDDPAPFPTIQVRPKRSELQPHAHPESIHSGKTHYPHARGEHSHPLSRPSSSSSIDPARPRTRSLGGASLPGRPRLDDITEHIPIRTSSLAHSCSTPTTTMSSGHSSNPFPRPQSQHTANTSVDIPLPTISKQGHERHVSGSATSGGDYDNSAYYTAAEDEYPPNMAGPPKRTVDVVKPLHQSSSRSNHSGSTQNLNNYASLAVDYSDDDSFIEKPSVVEEGLLFDDFIYGDAGRSLPGLFDAISGPSSPTAPRTPTSAVSKPTVASNRSTPRKPHGRRKLRHSHSTPFSYSSHVGASAYGSTDEEDFDSFSDSEYEFIRQQAFAKLPEVRIDAPKRPSMYGVIEEDDEEKVDARTAAKLRGDMRRKERSSMSQTRRGKRPVERRRRYEDEGHAADTEDSGGY
ncbi:Fc.00g079780.m01.CDS01 [Cosmosporella sp. VM-42]